MKKKRIADGLRARIDARKRHHLSHAQVQMARELGMNPRRLGGLDNRRQERSKLPLPLFIEELCRKRFGRAWPEFVFSIEEHARQQEKKKAEKRESQAAAPQGGRGKSGCDRRQVRRARPRTPQWGRPILLAFHETRGDGFAPWSRATPSQGGLGSGGPRRDLPRLPVPVPVVGGKARCGLAGGRGVCRP